VTGLAGHLPILPEDLFSKDHRLSRQADIVRRERHVSDTKQVSRLPAQAAVSVRRPRSCWRNVARRLYLARAHRKSCGAGRPHRGIGWRRSLRTDGR
jgi:hypothetical protein